MRERILAPAKSIPQVRFVQNRMSRYNIFMQTDCSKDATTPRDRGLFDLTPDTLRSVVESWGEPRFRVRQIMEWVYRRGAGRYDEMTNLSKPLRSHLEESLPIFRSQVLRKQDSRDGTTKLLLQWPDAATSECVLIPGADRRTACISTQVGCPIGCLFCASGLSGLQRQLSAGEIVEQAMHVRKLCGEANRLTNVVFMGLGEPLANYDATIQAVRTINAEWGMGIGARKITVSTVGLPDQMRKLADNGLQITLALSLHAPTDELRHQLIPWSRRVTIDELVSAGAYYFKRTGREITLEYILLGGVNDEPSHARKLATIARKIRSNVNLIAYNPVEGLPYARPEDAAVARFDSILAERGINVHVRRSRGLDIDAACGQLRRTELDRSAAGSSIDASNAEPKPNQKRRRHPS